MAERTLNWTNHAKADVVAILEFYYHRNGNSDYGNRLVREFQERMDGVVTNPYLGEKWKRSGFRYVVVSPFQLFYRVTKTEIIVSMVWDSRRDSRTLNKHLRRTDS